MRAGFGLAAGVSACSLLGTLAAGQAPSAGSPASPAAELTRADLQAWLDGFIPYALQQDDIAGAVVLVLRDGQVLLQKGYGYADVAKLTPMDPQRTIVGVGSVSKLFTWTAVMQQVEQGKLDLDRDINDYLDVKIPPAFGKPLTLRNLMTHSAGFEERTFKQSPRGATPRALREYIQGVPAPERIYPPGTVEAYSNYGSMLAGYLVERASGERFADYIDRHILEPLEMRHSSFRWPVPERLQSDLARVYDVASGQPLPPEDGEEPAGDPSGHLATTASDISHFMLAHLQEGRYGDYQLLQPATAQLMHTPTFVPLPGAHGVALGFFRLDYNERRIIAHLGDIAGFHTDLELLPDQHVGFFMAVNSNGTERGLLGAAHLLRGSLFHGFMDRYFPSPPRSQEPTTATAKEHARLVQGEYRMSRRPVGDFMELEDLMARAALKLEIKANDDGTIETPGFLDFERGRPQQWREVAPFQWREVGGRRRLNMKVEGGRLKGWLPQDIFSFVLEPVPLLKSVVNLRLLALAAAVLALTTLAWPVPALARRRYGRRPELDRRESRADRLARLAVAFGLLFLLGWVGVLMADVPSKVGLDYWIRLVQLIGLLCLPGAAVAIWNGWLTCRGRRTGWAKVGSVVMALALVELVWFSFAFHLLSAGLNY